MFKKRASGFESRLCIGICQQCSKTRSKRELAIGLLSLGSWETDLSYRCPRPRESADTVRLDWKYWLTILFGFPVGQQDFKNEKKRYNHAICNVCLVSSLYSCEFCEMNCLPVVGSLSRNLEHSENANDSFPFLILLQSSQFNMLYVHKREVAPKVFHCFRTA